MNAPQLTAKVAKKILSIIDQLESDVASGNATINSQYYRQLADLYHFQKDFKSEAEILQRYVQLDPSDLNKAANDDLVEIYERIDRANALIGFKKEELKPAVDLALEPISEEIEKISISSKKKTAPRSDKQHKEFIEKKLKGLTVCAAYTGRSDRDEVIQLALVLFEYCAKSEKPAKVLKTLVTNRKPLHDVPEKKLRKFGLSSQELKQSKFDYDGIKALFDEADMVISHNDADIERNLIITLIPDLINKRWFSSQKDIPWGALGFDSKSLSKLVLAHGNKVPHSSLDRANAIFNLLLENEPNSDLIFLERLHNMQPMKDFQWTPELLKKHNQLKRQGKVKAVKIGGVALVLVGFGISLWQWILSQI
ncbi:MAG: hypothetical protein OQK51_15640 [Kangiellaceae bacterium]|nr:hypothetical protein [Kangiellaceae bacterium]